MGEGGALAVYVVRRLVALVVRLGVISFGIFGLLYLAPGNPVATILGRGHHSAAEIQAVTHQFHLDKPFLEQYAIWAKGVLHFHFGTSITTSLPVADVITARLPTSVFLGVYAFVLTIVFGVGLGLLAALKSQTAIDRGTVAASLIGLSTPAFVAGVFLIYLFAIVVHWFPASGKGEGFVDQVWHLTLPAISLALTSIAYVLKHTRAAVLGVLQQDYVTFARARGLSLRRILITYMLRNALIPVITISGLVLSGLVVGAVLTEVTFSIQGIGNLLVQSASSKDIPTIQAVAVLVAAVIIVANLLADVAYAFADPRVRLGRD
jgi:peptide/nickel transport system permease protein